MQVVSRSVIDHWPASECAVQGVLLGDVSHILLHVFFFPFPSLLFGAKHITPLVSSETGLYVAV